MYVKKNQGPAFVHTSLEELTINYSRYRLYRNYSLVSEVQYQEQTFAED